MGLKKLKKIHEEWDCVTSLNQVSWIDHESLYETGQQNAIFKLSYVQTMLYKTCYGGFLKRFLMRTPESAFESFKNLKRYFSHFLFFRKSKR